jgi:Glycosyltransferase
MESDLVDSFEFRHVRQPLAAGGINIALIREMAREMKAFHPDLAHIRGLGNEGFHGVAAARLARVPRILVSVHGSVGDVINSRGRLRQGVVANLLEPLTLRMATAVCTVCESALNKPILRRVQDKVVGVVPNGVDLPNLDQVDRAQTRQELSIGRDAAVLIVVARLALDKGHLDLLEAMEGVTMPTQRALHLLIVGDGPDSAAISQRASRLRNVTVHLLGRRLDVNQLLRASDVFVFPTLHENMSNALLEAMASGLPVVATNVGGNTEVVSRGGASSCRRGIPDRSRAPFKAC